MSLPHPSLPFPTCASIRQLFYLSCCGWWLCSPGQSSDWALLLNLVSPFSSVQFSSVTQLCPTLCDPMNRSTPGLPVHHQLLEFTQIHVRRVGDADSSHPLSHLILCLISSSVVPFSVCPQSRPASVSFPMSQLFTRGGQSIGVSASASVLPMNTQD